MKRTGFKPRTTGLSTKTRVKQVSDKRKARSTTPEGQDDAWYRDQVLAMPCMFCEIDGLPQLSPTGGHHPCHRRYSKAKRPDQFMLPTCDGHHQGDFDTSKVSVHREPDKWKALYGDDIDHAATIQMRILGYTVPDPFAPEDKE